MDLQKFDLPTLLQTQAEQGTAYYEFLKPATLSMSMGIYQLPAGGEDKQHPHNEDEAYYVVSGQSMMVVGEDHFSVTAGSIIYVKAHVPHHFYDITEDMTILVFFSPAEDSKQST